MASGSSRMVIMGLDGRRVVDVVYRKEEIFEGPFLELAPDLVLLPSSGFDFKATLKAGQLSGRGIFTGKHTQKDAFLLTNDPSTAIIPDKPCVSDIVGIMDRLRERHGNR